MKILLEWALENMSYIDDDKCTYGVCKICWQPEWKHADDCEGIAWTKTVEEILKGTD